MERYPIVAIFADGCASASSGAVRKLRVSVTIHPNALCHMVLFLGLMPTSFFRRSLTANLVLHPICRAAASARSTDLGQTGESGWDMGAALNPRGPLGACGIGTFDPPPVFDFPP